jgi:hypothetical protein
MKPQTLTVAERAQQLKSWEAGRKTERSMVVYTLCLAFPFCFCFADLVYSILTHWHWCSIPFAAVCALIAATCPLALWFARWLQTWASYVERRLEDIEAKIDGRSPSYYTSEGDSSFSSQPLHERLERIEALLTNGPGSPL